MRPTRWTIFDTRSSVREMYPALSAIILVCLIAAPLGFVPKELLDLPNWYRGFSFVTLVVFVGLGIKWKDICPYILARRAHKQARQPGFYEITLEEEITLQCECTPGELVTFKGLGRRFFKFDDDQDRVLFVIGRK